MLSIIKKSVCINHELKLKRKQFTIPINAKTEVGASALSEIRNCGPENIRFDDSLIISEPCNSFNKECFMSQEISGFIQLPRSLLENEIWNSLRLKYRHVLLIILKKCAWKPCKYNDNGQIIHLNPGELCVSYRELAEWCNQNVKFREDEVDRNIIERAVSVFLKLKIIRQEVRHCKMVITVTIPGVYDTEKKETETPIETKPRLNRDIKEEIKEINNPPLTPPFSKNSKKQKKDTPQKEEVAKNVFLTKVQIEDLIKKLDGNSEDFQKCVNKLSEYKISTGRVYSNDYTAFTRWVLKWLKEEKSRNGGMENSAEFHKKICDEVSRNFPCEKDIHIGYNYIEFVNGSYVANLKFGSHGFIEQVENNLRKRGLDFSFLRKLGL